MLTSSYNHVFYFLCDPHSSGILLLPGIHRLSVTLTHPGRLKEALLFFVGTHLDSVWPKIRCIAEQALLASFFPIYVCWTTRRMALCLLRIHAKQNHTGLSCGVCRVLKIAVVFPVINLMINYRCAKCHEAIFRELRECTVGTWTGQRQRPYEKESDTVLTLNCIWSI